MSHLFPYLLTPSFQDRAWHMACTQWSNEWMSMHWLVGHISAYTVWFFVFFSIFLATPRRMRDLSSPTRDQTHGPCSGSTVSVNRWTTREVPAYTIWAGQLYILVFLGQAWFTLIFQGKITPFTLKIVPIWTINYMLTLSLEYGVITHAHCPCLPRTRSSHFPVSQLLFKLTIF